MLLPPLLLNTSLPGGGPCAYPPLQPPAVFPLVLVPDLEVALAAAAGAVVHAVWCL